MIFNGESKDYIRVKQELFRPPSPPIEFDVFDYSRGGSRLKKKRYTSMTLPVPIRIYHPKKRIEELKEELSHWLIHDDPKKLGFKDMPDRYYLAHYESMQLSEKGHFADGTINFFLPDGRRVGAEKTINVTTSNTTHAITGQDESPWTVEVVFSQRMTTFEVETNQGLYLLLGYEFIEGDRLKIAYDGRVCELNGRDIRFAIRLKSNYEMLMPGSLMIKANHACTLKYDERYY